MPAEMTESRRLLHIAAAEKIIRINTNGKLNFSDTTSKTSCRIAKSIYDQIGLPIDKGRSLTPQTMGKRFQELVAQYLRDTFLTFQHLRPGNWTVLPKASRRSGLEFEQYSHLGDLEQLAKGNAALRSSLATDYLITPDVIVFRRPEPDEVINRLRPIVDNASSLLTSLRSSNGAKNFLHASISCKYSLRSDRSQASRTEALNLLRNRKGRAPHIMVVTAEPMPSRLASVTLGTGDLDCVYHLFLDELTKAVKEHEGEDTNELLDIMIRGKRLRDISDLPLDLTL